MALLVTTDNRPIFLSSEVAVQLWLVKTGERKGTPKTRAKVKSIEKWYLNRETAPASYLQQNPVMVEKRVRGSGKVISQGRLPYVD
jgi:hypothetical protein